jgi:vitamin B12 transporter
MKKPLSKFIAAVTAVSCSTVVFANSALEEVIVSSSRIEMPVRQIGTSVSVINSEEIELRGYNSLTDILRTQPSVSVSNSGGVGKTTSLRIRGEESYRTLMMIDGVDVSDPTGTQVGPRLENFLTSNDIERVEILRGTQGFIYGADAGGVVNVFTKAGEGDLGGSLGLQAGRYGTQQIDASLSAGNEMGDFFISVTDFETDGFNARSDDTTLQDDDGAENTTVHAKLGWNATEELRLQLVVRDISAETEFDSCGFFTPLFVRFDDCKGESDQTTAKISANYDMGSFSHYLAYANTDIDRENIDAGVTSFATEGEINRVEYMTTYRFSDATTLTMGADLENEAAKISDIYTTGVFEETLDADRDQLGVYAEFNGELANNWFISAGLRNDDNDDFGNFTSGRLSTAYVMDFDDGSSIKYRASYGTGFRAPSLAEIGLNISQGVNVSSDLKEEKSKGYDLGVEYYAANGARVELVYFDQEIEDAIDFLFESDPVTFDRLTYGYGQQDGTSTSEGVELAVDYPLTDGLRLLTNVTYNETEDPNGDVRIRRPELVANIGLQWSALEDKLNIIASYRIAHDAVDSDFTNGGTMDLDDYEVLDISANYIVNEMITVFGRVENALDEDYQEVTDFNTSGSAAYAGVRFNF